MKRIFVLFITILIGNISNAQILKNLGDKLKRDAEWRIRNKADVQVGKAVDKVIEAPGKVIDKKKQNKKEEQKSSPENNSKKNSYSKINFPYRNLGTVKEIGDNSLIGSKVK